MAMLGFLLPGSGERKAGWTNVQPRPPSLSSFGGASNIGAEGRESPELSDSLGAVPPSAFFRHPAGRKASDTSGWWLI